LTGDGSFATYELFIHAQQKGINMIVRIKLNARLFHLPPTQYLKGKRGAKGSRRQTDA
jgi:hypothetical protein